MTVVFLDRDGVINQNREDYVKLAEEMVFLPEAFEGLAKLKDAGIISVLVSNQAGVADGLIHPEELDSIDKLLIQEVAHHGGEIAASYYCTHSKEEGCTCRKPGTGLLETASLHMGFELAGSYMIGDALDDIQAGLCAGCTTILVLTGRASLEEIPDWSFQPDFIAPSLTSAVDWIVSRENSN